MNECVRPIFLITQNTEKSHVEMERWIMNSTVQMGYVITFISDFHSWTSSHSLKASDKHSR